MESKELQKLTASEPLTLSEEYAMQASWRQDADKLTFIVCTPPSTSELPDLARPQSSYEKITPGKQDAAESMLGDVNMFLFDDDENGEENGHQKNENEHPRQIIGEIEIMIAQKEARGKGIAKEALMAFLWYITTSISAILAEFDNSSAQKAKPCVLKYLRVKIDKDNIPSINLFQKLGFTKTNSEPNYFGEVELRRPFVNDKLSEVEEMVGGQVSATKLAYESHQNHGD